MLREKIRYGIIDERFPWVYDWHCDRCGAYLNSQEGFDDTSIYGNAQNVDIKTAYPETIFMHQMMSLISIRTNKTRSEKR